MKNAFELLIISSAEMHLILSSGQEIESCHNLMKEFFRFFLLYFISLFKPCIFLPGLFDTRGCNSSFSFSVIVILTWKFQVVENKLI